MSIEEHRGARRPVSFKERMRAWWQGADEHVPAPRVVPVPSAVPQKRVNEENLVEPLAPWETPAMRIGQLLWGKGHLKPGGTDHFLELAKPLGLDPTKSLMEFGVGLGGGARAVRRTFGAWITGYELDADLARAAKEMSVLAKLEKAVDIVRYDAQGFAPRPSGYDGILSTETLYRIERKEDLLIKLAHSLKSRGQLVITDFVLGPGVSADDERLKAVAPGAAFFWPANRYVRHFREQNFDLRVSEDITARYRSLVVDGCKRVAEGGPAVTAEAKAHPEAMVTLLNLWTSRVAAFDSGLLKVMRFSAIKLGNLKLMSNW